MCSNICCFFSSRRRHTSCALVTGVQTCALPICAVAALSLAQDELRAKSRDLVRRNAWAAAGIEAFVANAIGTGIKPQSMVQDQATREAIHSLWWDWCEEADAAGLTDFYGQIGRASWRERVCQYV